MLLNIQIYSLLFNFLYGIFFSFILDFHYKFTCKRNVKIKLLLNFLFIINNIFLYFIILRKINGGILHIYFLLVFLLAIFVESKLRKFIANYFKWCYN